MYVLKSTANISINDGKGELPQLKLGKTDTFQLLPLLLNIVQEMRAEKMRE